MHGPGSSYSNPHLCCHALPCPPKPTHSVYDICTHILRITHITPSMTPPATIRTTATITPTEISAAANGVIPPGGEDP